MRELEFLPEWYPRLIRRKRMVALQGWITIMVTIALGMWLLSAERNIHFREKDLGDVAGLLRRSEADVQRLEVLLDLESKLGHQDEIFAKIGRPVEATRLLTTLEEMMPPDMALLDVSMETQEIKTDTVAAMAAVEKTGAPMRRLTAKVQGVSPTDADLANFLARLTAKPFFSQVVMTYSRPRAENGHQMREFEVAFAIDLSANVVN
jgi:hypothetical protein